jgi:IclR family transcriptional regulator, acetate operon repressor
MSEGRSVTSLSGGDGDSVRRVAAVLDVLGESSKPLGVSELSRQTGLPKSSAQRLLRAMVSVGMVERRGAEYCLGLRMFELGQRVPRQRDLRDAARPYMADLREVTRMTVNLALLEGNEVVYVDVVRGPDAPALPTFTGGRYPAHATGIGKAILAFSSPEVVTAVLDGPLPQLSPGTITDSELLRVELSRIVGTGVAYDREESKAGVVCAACPVFGEDGEVIAGLSISGWHGRMELERAAAAVRTSALSLSRAVAQRRPS